MPNFEREARRIARDRRLHSEAQEKMQRAEEARLREIKWENTVRQTKEEVSQVLQLITDVGLEHSDVKEVRVPIFGGMFRVVKAGWHVISWSSPYYDSTRQTPVYLLSDGRFCLEGEHPWFVEEAKSKYITLEPSSSGHGLSLQGLLYGLRQFHKKLDPNYKLLGWGESFP